MSVEPLQEYVRQELVHPPSTILLSPNKDKASHCRAEKK